MSSRYQASDRTPANGATVSKDLPDHKTKNFQLIMKSGLALLGVLFAFTTMPSTSHSAEPNFRAESNSNSDTGPAARSKAENNARYKRLRAKAHRNAARAKAHARAVRAAEESR